jgi:hypothetical protein
MNPFRAAKKLTRGTARTIGLSAVEGLYLAPLPGGPSGLLDLMGHDDDERVRVLERLFASCSDDELGTLMSNVQAALLRRHGPS